MKKPTPITKEFLLSMSEMDFKQLAWTAEYFRIALWAENVRDPSLPPSEPALYFDKHYYVATGSPGGDASSWMKPILTLLEEKGFIKNSGHFMLTDRKDSCGEIWYVDCGCAEDVDEKKFAELDMLLYEIGNDRRAEQKATNERRTLELKQAVIPKILQQEIVSRLMKNNLLVPDYHKCSEFLEWLGSLKTN